MSEPTTGDPHLWIRALTDGDMTAWKKFVKVQGPSIRYVGSRMGFNEADCEDLLQNTLLRVHSNLHALREPERLSSWVYSVALNEARQMLRRIPPTEFGSNTQEVDLPSDLPLPDEMWEATERQEQVSAALRSLDERCRRLLELLYWAVPKPGYAEISREIGIAVGSIGPIRGRCLEKLEKGLRAVSRGARPASTQAREEGASLPPEEEKS